MRKTFLQYIYKIYSSKGCYNHITERETLKLNMTVRHEEIRKNITEHI